MYIAYYDEAGDDGFPKYSSPLFVLTACYLHHLNWKETQAILHQFRGYLKNEYGLPVKIEFHCKDFLLNKGEFHKLGFSGQQRVEVMNDFCGMIAQLQVKVINIAIIKPRLQSETFNVLDWAFKMSIQRIENDLDPTQNPTNRFSIITDYGRVGKMRKTSRRMQRINYIRSKFDESSYRKEIQTLIEDPLPKDSHESYFIQVCDLISYIVYLYVLTNTKTGKPSNRMPEEVTKEVIEGWLKSLLPCLNRKVSVVTPYGIKIHPPKPNRAAYEAAARWVKR